MRNSVTVLIEPLAREKILAFAEAVTTEIGGLMTVRQQGQTLIVEDAWVVPQEVTQGGVHFEVGHFEDHIKAMGWPNGKPMPHICMGTWHSHGNGGVFWSSVDEHDLSEKYAMRGFLVNVVVNRKGEWLSQVDSMVGPEHGKPSDYVLVTVPSTVKLIALRDAAIAAYVEAEIKANVRERTYPAMAGFVGNGVWDDDGFWHPNGLTDGHGYQGYAEAFAPRDKSNKRKNEPHRGDLTPFIKARQRDPILGGVWSIDKKHKRMEKWVAGKIVASIADMGDGEMTLYDDNGKVIMTDKRYRPKGFLPPAEL